MICITIKAKENASGQNRQNKSETSVNGAIAQEHMSNVMKYHKKTGFS